MATTHSQKCCERLVEEGAVEILLCQISAVTRSIPDQEVLKHCLSTLRNLARYNQLADVLIDQRGSIETIFRELLRSASYYLQLQTFICFIPLLFFRAFSTCLIS